MRHICRTALLINLALAANAISPWPEYIRGKGNYLWATSQEQRQNGLNFGAGATSRLRRALHRMVSGDTIRIAAVGGSITVGSPRYDGFPWPEYVENYMADHYDGKVTVKNGAVGGTGSAYMSVCYNQHVPKDVDIVIVEYSINDGAARHLSEQHKRAQERLIRKLLNHPNKPAVLIANALSWFLVGMENWYNTAEAAYNELSTYYSLPTVSLRACCFHDIMNNVTGFSTTFRAIPGVPIGPPGVSFFGECSHLDGSTGLRVLAELVVHAFETTIEGLRARPYNPEQEAVGPLPIPLHPGNYDSAADRCFVGEDLKQILVKAQDFEWVNEDKGGRARFGMIANKPQAVLEFTLDTTAASLPANQTVLVMVAHLRSYEHMGLATVKCLENCVCQEGQMQGHHQHRHSQMYLHKFEVTQSKQCVIQLTVSESTLSGEHKVKVLGIMVSEESGHSLISSCDALLGAMGGGGSCGPENRRSD